MCDTINIHLSKNGCAGIFRNTPTGRIFPSTAVLTSSLQHSNEPSFAHQPNLVRTPTKLGPHTNETWSAHQQLIRKIQQQ